MFPIPDGQEGEWKIETTIVDEISRHLRMRQMMNTGRFVPEGTYRILYRDRVLVMSNTPDEKMDYRSFLREAQAKDIVIGANIWQYTSDDDGDKWYLQRVVEVLKPSDQFKAYIAEDGCRYGLDDAWIEIFIKDIYK